MDKFREEIKELLKSKGIPDIQIEMPPNPSLGDYAVPCFATAKTLKKAPNMISAELAKDLSSPMFEKITATGPYLNFFVDPKEMAKETLLEIHKEKEGYGRSEIGKNERIMIEFSSPNTNKPLLQTLHTNRRRSDRFFCPALYCCPTFGMQASICRYGLPCHLQGMPLWLYGPCLYRSLRVIGR